MNAPLEILKAALEHKKEEAERIEGHIEESQNMTRTWVARKARLNLEIIEIEDFIAGTILQNSERKEIEK